MSDPKADPPHPYSDLPAERFWRSAVASREPLEISGLWTPKFAISRADRIVTAGSCFAQHIGRALAARGYHWFDAEPAPELLPPERRSAYHYGTFSFRTGNIYTPNMLAQWLEWAFGHRPLPEAKPWQSEGRHVDPFRPAIEPGGFESPEEVTASRGVTLEAIRQAVKAADVFVFTLGLTESWQHAQSGIEYAICPGTVAGKFRPRFHRFVNHGYEATLARMRDALAILRAEKPGIRVLLTVSPVPLTATASGEHVLVATTWSKSVLRAVAGALAESEPDVDYFPSYEIITAPPFGGRFYAANQRSVLPEGVSFVMDSFFADQARIFGTGEGEAAEAVAAPQPEPAGEQDAEEAADALSEDEMDIAEDGQGDPLADADDDEEDGEEGGAAQADIRCEEEMLDAFRPR